MLTKVEEEYVEDVEGRRGGFDGGSFSQVGSICGWRECRVKKNKKLLSQVESV